MFGTDDVKKLAALARIELGKAETEKLAKELSSIVSFVDQVQRAPTGTEEDKPSLRNVMRDDIDPYPRGAFSEKLLSAAPKREGRYFKVRKIITRS